jgi:ABC-2 type transport system permease protein
MMQKMLLIESKLVVRDAILPLFGVLLPVALLGFGFIPGTTRPDPDLHGLLGIDTVIPSLAIAVALALVGTVMLPTYMASYRERGILRRLATTPATPRVLLGAQLVIHIVVILVTVVAVLGIGTGVMGMSVPRHAFGFVLALTLSILALFSIGLIVAAVAPNARVANGVGLLLWFLSAFFAGIYLPKEQMPHLLSRIGDFTPLGAARQAIQDAWGGSGPQPQHLIVLAAVAAICGAVALKLFRWQ